MNRANQQQLFQEANQGVINIRQTELNYYINLFTVFGTNAAIIGGFTYGILTQNIINYTSKHVDVYKFCYYVLAAMTIASSVHVIVCTMLVQVYGPGLALNGPLGSMSRAAEGMAQEQKQIIGAVIIMVASFGAATIWLFFVIMNFYEAVASSACFLVVVYYWYYYCERIYLRFYWKTQDGLWNGTADRDSRVMSDDDDPANPRPVFNATNAPPPSSYKRKKIKLSMKWAWGKKPTVEEEGDDIEMEDNADGGGMYGNKVLNYLFRNPATMSNEQRESITRASLTSKAAAMAADKETVMSGGGSTSAGAGTSVVAMEGYFTTRGRSEQQVILESRRWERQYFVLFRTGEFYVYKSRQDFRLRPKSPVFSRPLRLIDHFVKIANADQDTRTEYEDDGKTVSSVNTSKRDSTKPPPFRFQITLVPRENEEAAEGMGTGAGRPAQLRNQWLLRCDTEEELEIWLGSIRDVCPSCFRD